MRAKEYAITVHFVRAPKDNPLFQREGKWTQHFDDPGECGDVYRNLMHHYRAAPHDYAIEPTIYKRCELRDL
jgi:hypothetical protein